MPSPVNVLFVCLGNICRSPMAKGVLVHRLREAGLDGMVMVDSAGTHAYQVGSPPDPRALAALRRRSIEVGGTRARRIEAADFQKFDYVIAMDRDNYGMLRYTCPKDRRQILHLLMDFAPQSRRTEVPDPYTGDEEGFEKVLDLVEIASEGLLADIRRRFLSPAQS